MKYLTLLFCLFSLAAYAQEAELLFLKASSYEQEGKFEEAKHTYQELLLVEKSPTVYLKISDMDLFLRALDDAVKTLEEATAEFPKDAEVHFRLGALYAEQAEQTKDKEREELYQDALSALRRAAKLEPAEKYLAPAAALSTRMGDTDGAIKLYDELIKLELFQYYAPKAMLFIGKGRKKEGIALLEKGFELTQDVVPLLRLADIYLTDNNTAKGVDYLKKAADLRPDIVYIDLYLGDFYLNKGDREKAFAYYRTASKSMPSSHVRELYLKIGNLLIDKGDYEAAASAFKEAIALEAADGYIYYLAGVSLLLADDAKGGALIFKDGLAKYPDFTMMRLRAGINLIVLKDYNGAVEVLTKIDEVERDTQYYLFLGEAYSGLKEIANAKDTFKAGLEEYPFNTDIMLSLAAAYLEEKDNESSIEVLQRAYKTDPNSARVQNFLGYLYADMNVNLDEAERLIDKALAQEPNNAAYIDSKGWVLFRRGKIKEAEALLKRAYSLSPEDKEIAEHINALGLSR